MPAILKEKHFRFCTLIENFMASHSDDDSNLAGLEKELQDVYEKYRQGIEDLRTIVAVYDEKQRSIKNRMKQMLRKETKDYSS